MAPTHYTRLLLAERPTTQLTPTTFKSEVLPFDSLRPGLGQVLVQVLYLSVDPAMRIYVRDVRNYAPPVQPGELMRALFGLGTVVEAGPGCTLVPGDIVKGTFGWTEYKVIDEKALRKDAIPPNGQLLDLLGPLGHHGTTAYFGVLEIGALQPGETLVVSCAAGATGSLACQIGRKRGARVVAIAGSDAKVRWLQDALGVDAALNYKSDTFATDFVAAAGYVDVYFDCAGGRILDLVLSRLNKNARIVMCGTISTYDNPTPYGLTNYMNIVAQCATITGFLGINFASRYDEAFRELRSWIADGSLQRRYYVLEGMDKAWTAINMLFTGENTGKLVIKVSDPPKV